MGRTYYSLIRISEDDDGFACTQHGVAAVGRGDTAYEAIEAYVAALK